MHQHHLSKHDGISPESTQYIRCAAAALVGVALAAGCASDVDRTELYAAPVDIAAFEEYRDAARVHMVDGEPIYQVEFDLFFTEAGLFELYAARQQPTEPEAVDKSVVITQISTGLDLTFERGEDALTITYCVSDTFGADQAQAIQDMQDATADWQMAANFHFEYDEGMNGDCVGGATGIDVAVIPSPFFQSACATPPYMPPSQQGNWCPGYTQGTLGFDYANYPWAGVWGTAGSRGVMRHELGHILGLRHEHGWSPTPCESQTSGDIGGRQLTSYDADSAMHYPPPQCAGNPDTTFAVTDLDAEGVRQIYGMPAAWYPAMSQPLLL